MSVIVRHSMTLEQLHSLWFPILKKNGYAHSDPWWWLAKATINRPTVEWEGLGLPPKLWATRPER